MDLTMPKTARSKLLTTISDELLSTNTLHCYSNEVNITPDLVLTDLTESAFGGYAAISNITFGEPFYDNGDVVAMVSGGSQFNHSGSGDAETVRGLYLKDTDGDLIAVHELETPKGMATANDSLPVDVKFVLA